jgi:protein-S-isoprenylcysteine O-methyltransferase Ste14
MTTAPALDLHVVQRIRKVAVGLALLVLISLALVSQSFGGADGRWHEVMEAVGLGAILVAIVGRAWCSLYVGGRKKAEIVARGPYSITRNPLYLFSFVAAFGMGAQSGTLTIAVLFVIAAIMVFTLTVQREERFLRGQFGAVYEAYVARTPRFWPRFSLWQDEAELTIRPSFFVLTIRDGLTFLLAIPLFEMIDAGQQGGVFSVLAHLI